MDVFLRCFVFCIFSDTNSFGVGSVSDEPAV